VDLLGAHSHAVDLLGARSKNEEIDLANPEFKVCWRSQEAVNWLVTTMTASTQHNDII
jgi:hypothetical protein